MFAYACCLFRLTRSLAVEFVEKRKIELEGGTFCHYFCAFICLIGVIVCLVRPFSRYVYLEFLVCVVRSEYTRELLQNPALRQTEIMMSFLEVPDSVRPMLLRNPISGDHNGSDLESRVPTPTLTSSFPSCLHCTAAPHVHWWLSCIVRDGVCALCCSSSRKTAR